MDSNREDARGSSVFAKWTAVSCPVTQHKLRPRAYPGCLSIVIPLYNECEVIPELRSALTTFADGLPCAVEIVLVNDGSTDTSVALLSEWAETDARARLLCLARNFGHQAAVTAGLDHARGDAVVVMDADLQDPLEVIHDMIAEYRQGYDVVYGRRISRDQDTVFKRASAWLFYRIMRALIYPDLPADTGDFRLVSRRCLNALIRMRETHRFLRGMVAWVGFPQTEVGYHRRPRQAGKTKYPLHKMLQLAWTAAVSFSPAPLRLSFAAGFSVALVGIGYGVYAFMRSLLGLYVVPGWTSLIVVICLIGGAILISIGVAGEYIARIFEEVKGRPLYIVSENITAASGEPDLLPQLARLHDATESALETRRT